MPDAAGLFCFSEIFNGKNRAELLQYLRAESFFNMKFSIITLFCCFSLPLFAQTTVDTTIYNVSDEMPYPLFRSCAPNLHPSWSWDSIRMCAEAQLFNVLAANIRYPDEARKNNVQGTVVISCVIEPKAGRMTHLQVLKDIGSGCGPEAMRVLTLLDSAGLRWTPGLLQGQPVRVRQTIPIRFRLQEPLPYYVSTDGDTIYTNVDKATDFTGGVDSLVSFLVNRIEYPKSWEDSCKTGVIEMATVIMKDRSVKVSNVLDFNNLGMDFQFEAMRVARRTAGAWIPAEYKGNPVNTTLPLRVFFKSDAATCKNANEVFDRATILSDEGAKLLSENNLEMAIRKWNEALTLQPDNTELLYYRGTAYLNSQKRDEACKDFNRVKQLLGYTWFEDVRRLICGD